MRMQSGFATLRDLVSFGLGAGILIYCIVVEPPPPEPISIGVGVALAGLPTAAAVAGRKTTDDG